MNLSRCEKGHFFDKEKYATCPHCAQGVQMDESLTTVFTEDLNSGLNPTEPLEAAGGNRGIPPISAMSAPAPVPAPSSIAPTAPVPSMQEAAPTPVGAFGNMPAFGNIPSQEPEDTDHTVAFYDDIFAPQGSGTVTAPIRPANTPSVSTPCVGWLVVTKGMHLGQDFRLKVGKNFIGRDSQMDIVLDGDKSVSRNRHAVVVYEPKQHMYLVQPGESSELVYLNDDVVLNPMKLSAYDVITVGEVNMLFMPLCGEKFNWTDELKKRE
ncbi:MAG: FHA domain-containing protein [Lachnospiraceae bacterium]|nr:FHA domain-containing protein [Lachnospiraceae bacterium]